VASPAPRPNPPLPVGELLLGLALAAYIVAADLALKIIARLGACPDLRDVASAFEQAWHLPEGCSASALAGPSLALAPAIRDSAAGLAAGSLGGGAGQAWGLGLVAVGAIAAVLILRWRWRSSADALALGTLWGGLLAHAGPRLFGAGHGFSELFVAGLSTGIADLAILAGIVWIGGRVIGETVA
jgi:hypothetical protein